MNSYEYVGKLLQKKRDLELKLDSLYKTNQKNIIKEKNDLIIDIIMELRETKSRINFVYRLKERMDNEMLHKKVQSRVR